MTAVLLISCQDQRGITAAVTSFIFQNGGNILHADQHIDEQTNTFFMRLEWSLDAFKLAREAISPAFSVIADEFRMHWEISFSDIKTRMAIFVSKHLHCLHDILYRHRMGHLSCDIPLIVSNHKLARKTAEEFGIDFFHFPITQESKLAQEEREIALLQEWKIDLVVLARYHQILTDRMVRAFPNKIINIHHSFLPAFAGKKPYHQAFEKGVKIIGATSHYVIEALDEGPIIEQDTVRVSHRDALDDLIRKGEDLEKVVFSRAIRWHLEKKVLAYNNKTVVFD